MAIIYLCIYLPLSLLGDDFDPVLIAQKLRAVGDALNDEAHFRAALSDLQKAAAVQVSGEKPMKLQVS